MLVGPGGLGLVFGVDGEGELFTATLVLRCLRDARRVRPDLLTLEIVVHTFRVRRRGADHVPDDHGVDVLYLRNLYFLDAIVARLAPVSAAVGRVRAVAPTALAQQGCLVGELEALVCLARPHRCLLG